MLRTPATVILFGALACGCTVVFAYPERTAESSVIACADEVDNDADGRVDCYDPDCASFCVEQCSDGIDNDLDGATDCADARCAGFPGCAEDRAELCGDGVDNDGDGDTDCDDRSCSGFCPEDDPATCNDGWDNDGDGAADGADPRCWLITPPLPGRCASVEGSVFASSFGSVESAESQFYFTLPAPVERRPPTLGGALELGADTTAGTQRALAGGWEGTEISLFVDGDVRVLLAAAGTTGVGTPAFAASPILDVDLSGTALTVSVPGDSAAVPLAPREGWQLLRVRVSEGVVVVQLEPVPEIGSGAPSSTTSVAVPETELPSSRLLLTGPGTIADIQARFGSLDPCGAPVPVRETDQLEDVGLDFAAATWVNASGGREICALAVGCGPSLQAYTVSLQPLLTAPAPLGIPASAVGLDWDHDAGLLRAVATDPVDGRLRSFDSPDCVTWTEREVAGAPRPGPRYRIQGSCADLQEVGLGGTVSYVVRGDAHEIYWQTETGADGVLARAVSTDGGASFGPPEIVLADVVLGPMAEVSAVGDELVITQLADPAAGEVGVRIGVLAGGAYAPLPGAPLFAPSGVPGTFDRDALRSAALTPLGSSVVVLLGGLGDYLAPPGARAIRVGYADLTFDRDGD